MSPPLLFQVMKTPAAALGLRTAERLVLLQLLDAYNPKRNGAEVWPSMTRLADLTGMNIKTVRAAKHQLHHLGLIKISSDKGKSCVCSIIAEVIHRLVDPYQKREGYLSTPLPKTVGDPYQIREGTPTKLGTLMTNRTTKEITNLGHSPILDVSAGPRQRKMALPGVVAETEQPTIEKTKQTVTGNADFKIAQSGE